MITPTRQQRMARAKFALPSMVTLLSIACGFGSIVISVDNAWVGVPSDYRLAAILLVLAGVFDALDGLVARATNTQSDFGMQLDSIADVMNFGCAPGLLLYCWGFVQFGQEHPALLRAGGIACFIFVACGALRRRGRGRLAGTPDHHAAMRAGDAADGGRWHLDGVHRALSQFEAAEKQVAVAGAGAQPGPAGLAAKPVFRAVLRGLHQPDLVAQSGVDAGLDEDSAAGSLRGLTEGALTKQTCPAWPPTGPHWCALPSDRLHCGFD